MPHEGLSMWSKDIILLFSDGDTKGTQAWLRAYHGMTGKFKSCCLQGTILTGTQRDRRAQCWTTTNWGWLYLERYNSRLSAPFFLAHRPVLWYVMTIGVCHSSESSYHCHHHRRHQWAITEFGCCTWRSTHCQVGRWGTRSVT